MRRRGLALIALAGVALATGGAPASAQPAPLRALVAGEVALQLAVRGSARSRPDAITFNVPITASADTAAAAKAANQAIVDRLRTALIANGIAPGAITLAPAGGMRMGFIGNEAYGEFAQETATGAMAAAAAELPKRKTAFSSMQIRLIDPAQERRVRDALDAQDQAIAGTPLRTLSDDREAKRRAIADALARARGEADAYAAALGLRVARITRVSNQPSGGAEGFAAAMQAMATANVRDVGDVVTEAQVVVDFVLAPDPR